jgi:probable HAF family extracellular repeat protein
MGAGGTLHRSLIQPTGLVELSKTRLRASVGADINDRGDVVGSAVFDPTIDVFHAARWNAHNRPQNLGTLAGGRSFAIAANDAGTVVGWSQAPQSASLTSPFRWTAERGMQPLGTAASEAGSARAINREGTVVGTAPLREGDPDHGFLWRPREGLVDLGTGSGKASGATGVNDQGMVTGFAIHFPNFGIGFVWTRSGGMIELGTPHANSSTADDLNNRGQVVGGIDGRAFVWTQGSGIVDLNTKVRGSPQGLVLRQALAINDGGAIVALTNTGLVLLTRRTLSGLRPLAGPIVVTGAARAGALLSFSVHFTDVDVRETHPASWDWGDGPSEPGTLNERNGSRHVSGQHRYQAEGEYLLTLTITDASGRYHRSAFATRYRSRPMQADRPGLVRLAPRGDRAGAHSRRPDHVRVRAADRACARQGGCPLRRRRDTVPLQPGSDSEVHGRALDLLRRRKR